MVAGALLPLLPGLLPGRTLAWRDSALLHGPVRGLVVDALRDGRLPLWNPWEGTGQALLAQALHAALHPVSIVTAAFSGSIDLFLAALVVAAALGAWVAARGLGAGPAPAAVAAFGYGLSGYVLGMTSNAGYLAGAATLPWTVAGLREAGASRSGWLAAAAGVGAAGLAGDPGALASGAVVGLALAAERGGTRGLLRAAAGTALGVAGAAVQLLPTWVYLAGTLRGARGLASPAVAQWALDPMRLPEFLSPGLFVGLPRSFRAPVFEAFGSPADVPFPWAPSIFLGAPLLLLAATGARRRTGRLLLLLTLLLAWVALGHHAGAAQLLGAVPVWGALRFAEKMVAPLALCVALAAAVGTEEVAERGAGWLVRASALAAAVALAVGAVAWILPAAADPARDLYRMRLASGVDFAAVSLLLLAAAVAWGGRRPGTLGGAIAAVLFLQSAAASPFALHFGSMAALRERPPHLEAPAPGARVLSPLARNFEVGDGSGDAIDRSTAYGYRTGRPAANVAARVENVGAYTGFGTIRTAVVAGAGALRWPLLRRLGTTHVVAPDPGDDDDRRVLALALGPGAVEPAGGADGVRAWAVEHRPWASFAPGARTADGPRAAAHALAQELAAGRGTVVVEAQSAPATARGTVHAVSRRAAEVVIEAESEGPALLVVNDAHAPGWVAEIDGRPAPILAADVLVRAVPWPGGRHRLVMRYEPPEVALGIAVSAAAVVVALGSWLLGRRRRAGPPGTGI